MQLSGKILAGIAAAALLVPVGLSAQAEKPEVTGKGAGQGSERSAAAKLGPTEDKATGLDRAAEVASENSAVADGIPGGNGPAGEDGEADSETTRKAERENNAGGDGSGDSTGDSGSTTDGSTSTEGTSDALSTLLGATNGNGRGWKGSTEISIDGQFLAKAISCDNNGFEAEVNGGVGITNGQIKVSVGVLQQKGKPSDRQFSEDTNLWDMSVTALADFEPQSYVKRPLWTSPGSKIMQAGSGLGGNPHVYIKYQKYGESETAEWMPLGRCNGGMPGAEIPVSWKQPMYLSGNSSALYCTRTNSGLSQRGVQAEVRGAEVLKVRFLLSKHELDSKARFNSDLEFGGNNSWISSYVTLTASDNGVRGDWDRSTFGGNPSVWMKIMSGNSPVTLTTEDGYVLPGGTQAPEGFGYIGRCKDILLGSGS